MASENSLTMIPEDPPPTYNGSKISHNMNEKLPAQPFAPFRNWPGRVDCQLIEQRISHWKHGFHEKLGVLQSYANAGGVDEANIAVTIGTTVVCFVHSDVLIRQSSELCAKFNSVEYIPSFAYESQRRQDILRFGDDEDPDTLRMLFQYFYNHEFSSVQEPVHANSSPWYNGPSSRFPGMVPFMDVIQAYLFGRDFKIDTLQRWALTTFKHQFETLKFELTRGEYMKPDLGGFSGYSQYITKVMDATFLGHSLQFLTPVFLDNIPTNEEDVEARDLLTADVYRFLEATQFLLKKQSTEERVCDLTQAFLRALFPNYVLFTGSSAFLMWVQRGTFGRVNGELLLNLMRKGNHRLVRNFAIDEYDPGADSEDHHTGRRVVITDPGTMFDPQGDVFREQCANPACCREDHSAKFTAIESAAVNRTDPLQCHQAVLVTYCGGCYEDLELR